MVVAVDEEDETARDGDIGGAGDGEVVVGTMVSLLVRRLACSPMYGPTGLSSDRQSEDPAYSALSWVVRVGTRSLAA